MAPAVVTEPSRRDGVHHDVASPTRGSSGAPPLRFLEGRWRTAAAVLFAAAVALGLALRFWTRSALWLDEALTVDIARLPVHHIPAALRRDGAPPLYYVMLHYWMALFGTSDMAVRSLSGVLSVATLPIAWFAGRRYGGRTVAWAVVLLLATAPFAVYYATETRMYALVMFLTACGFVALDRAGRRPTPANILAITVVTSALLYSHYWSVYLVAVTGLALCWSAWRGSARRRRASLWSLGAVATGCLTFLPWLPIFVFQARHTGTPWAAPANLSAIIHAITGFTDNQATLLAAPSDQGRLLAILYFVLGALALFGVARDRWHVDLDLRTRPRARAVTFVVVGTLFVAIAGGILTGSAFSPRYASVVFVPLLLLLGMGVLTFEAPKIRAGILLVAAGAGLAVGVQNISTLRTQAPSVAAVLHDHARPGDIVAFCPDQLGPATYRLLPRGRYQLTTFPRGTSPAFVDWVNYLSVAERSSAVSFAGNLARDAGTTHRIWLVWAPGYQGFAGKCEQVVSQLADTPGMGVHAWLNQNPARYYEPMSLYEFAPTR